MEKINQDGVVGLEDLVKLLETSESTVRRDLDELEKAGKLRRVHGGAEKIQTLQEELTNREKSVKNVQEKQELAQLALGLIENGDVIFIDPGTTTDFLIDQLVQRELGVTVVTNSIHHAAKLVDGQVKTLIIGGLVKNSTDASVGQLAIDQINQLNVDKAFVGINGIDEDHLTTPDLEEAMVKRAILKSSKETYILADSSKLGRRSFAKVGQVSDVTLITTGQAHPLLEILRKKTKVVDS